MSTELQPPPNYADKAWHWLQFTIAACDPFIAAWHNGEWIHYKGAWNLSPQEAAPLLRYIGPVVDVATLAPLEVPQAPQTRH